MILNSFGKSTFWLRSPILAIMNDYITDKLQYVFDKKHFTEKLAVITGIQQGSKLHPFFSLIFIKNNPGAKSSISKMALFADDTSSFHSAKRYHLTFQNIMISTSNWLACNKLSIKTSKCETRSFGKRKLPKLIFANISIHTKPHGKYLGDYLDPKFKFCEHISYVAKNWTNFADRWTKWGICTQWNAFYLFVNLTQNLLSIEAY